MRKVAEWKIRAVESLKKEIINNRVVGIVGLRGIPSTQMAKIRASLRNKAKLVVSRNNLIKRALEEAAKDKAHVDKLIEHVADQCGLLLTNSDAFDLCAFVERTKTKAPARGGEVAPEDIIINEGPTGFKPGPLVGELQKAGIPAAIEGGKIVIKKTIKYVGAGEVITREKAAALTKLGINPVIVGLELRAAYEEGVIYPKDVLQIDYEHYRELLARSATSAYNLALRVGYITKATIMPLMAEAHTHAFNLALRLCWPTRETISEIIRTAYAQMLALAAHVPEALDEEAKSIVGAARSAVHEKGAAESEKTTAKRENAEKGRGKAEKKATEEDAAAGLSSLFG